METIQFLVEHGALLNVMDESSILNDEEAASALMHACVRGYVDIAKYIIDKGADLNLRNDQGNDALIVSINHNHFELGEYLINKGANVNAKNKRGFTPLMMATSKGSLKLTKMLVERGAIVNMINKDKAATALDFAYVGWNLSSSFKDKVQRKEYNEIIKYIKLKGGKTGWEMMK
jgi:ankyrin repeat protein